MLVLLDGRLDLRQERGLGMRRTMEQRIRDLEKDSHPPVLTVPAAEFERVMNEFWAELRRLRLRVHQLEQEKQDAQSRGDTS